MIKSVKLAFPSGLRQGSTVTVDILDGFSVKVASSDGETIMSTTVELPRGQAEAKPTEPTEGRIVRVEGYVIQHVLSSYFPAVAPMKTLMYFTKPPGHEQLYDGPVPECTRSFESGQRFEAVVAVDPKGVITRVISAEPIA